MYFSRKGGEIQIHPIPNPESVRWNEGNSPNEGARDAKVAAAGLQPINTLLLRSISRSDAAFQLALPFAMSTNRLFRARYSSPLWAGILALTVFFADISIAARCFHFMWTRCCTVKCDGSASPSRLNMPSRRSACSPLGCSPM